MPFQHLQGITDYIWRRYLCVSTSSPKQIQDADHMFPWSFSIQEIAAHFDRNSQEITGSQSQTHFIPNRPKLSKVVCFNGKALQSMISLKFLKADVFCRTQTLRSNSSIVV